MEDSNLILSGLDNLSKLLSVTITRDYYQSQFINALSFYICKKHQIIYLNISFIPVATVSIAILNAMIFAVGLLSGSQLQIIRNFGFIPYNLFSNNVEYYIHNSFPLSLDALTRLFSSMFIHTNIAHLAFNLLALVYIGGYAERSVGIPRYVIIYILAGIIGALFYGVIATYILGNAHTVLIGASGAISGILGIAAASGNIRAYYWLVFQIVFAVIGSVAAVPIAFTAHIGGFFAGLLLTKMLIQIERRRRTKYQHPSEDTYDTWR
jgi:rhomboid protease GluP